MAEQIGGYPVLETRRGGLGLVHKIYYSDWKRCLAIKQPLTDSFPPETLKKLERQFEQECAAWIRLGMHSNIVTCYFVKRLEGRLCAFAEWVDASDLKHLIDRRVPLYTGTEPEVFGRLMDIAIQTARGLAHTHACGLLHRDIKPGNILVSYDQNVKVTDFGTSCALTQQSQGGTPEYASPEQWEGAALSCQSDIWSYGAVLLELFAEKREWTDCKQLASSATELTGRCKRLQNDLKPLLEACLSLDPARRPDSFKTIADTLEQLYPGLCGKAYETAQSERRYISASALNNKALSLLELARDSGRSHSCEKAEKCWEEALRTDPLHPQSFFNYRIHLWREGRISSRSLLHDMNMLRYKRDDWLAAYLTGLAYLESGHFDEARYTLWDAYTSAGKPCELLRWLEEAQTLAGQKQVIGSHEYEIAAFSHDRKMFYALGKLCGTYDATTGEKLALLPDFFSGAYAIDESPEGGYKLKVCDKKPDGETFFAKEMQILRVRDGEIFHFDLGREYARTPDLVFRPRFISEEIIGIALKAGGIKLYDLCTNSTPAVIKGIAAFDCWCVNPDHTLIAAYTHKDNAIDFYSTGPVLFLQRITPARSIAKRADMIDFSEDGRTIQLTCHRGTDVIEIEPWGNKRCLCAYNTRCIVRGVYTRKVDFQFSWDWNTGEQLAHERSFEEQLELINELLDKGRTAVAVAAFNELPGEGEYIRSKGYGEIVRRLESTAERHELRGRVFEYSFFLDETNCYIYAIIPLEGNSVAVYTQDTGGENGDDSLVEHLYDLSGGTCFSRKAADPGGIEERRRQMMASGDEKAKRAFEDEFNGYGWVAFRHETLLQLKDNNEVLWLWDTCKGEVIYREEVCDAIVAADGLYTVSPGTEGNSIEVHRLLWSYR